MNVEKKMSIEYISRADGLMQQLSTFVWFWLSCRSIVFMQPQISASTVDEHLLLLGEERW